MLRRCGGRKTRERERLSIDDLLETRSSMSFFFFFVPSPFHFNFGNRANEAAKATLQANDSHH
jgi:hypothetical protein